MAPRRPEGSPLIDEPIEIRISALGEEIIEPPRIRGLATEPSSARSAPPPASPSELPLASSDASAVSLRDITATDEPLPPPSPRMPTRPSLLFEPLPLPPPSLPRQQLVAHPYRALAVHQVMQLLGSESDEASAFQSSTIPQALKERAEKKKAKTLARITPAVCEAAQAQPNSINIGALAMLALAGDRAAGELIQRLPMEQLRAELMAPNPNIVSSAVDALLLAADLRNPEAKELVAKISLPHLEEMAKRDPNTTDIFGKLASKGNARAIAVLADVLLIGNSACVLEAGEQILNAAETGNEQARQSLLSLPLQNFHRLLTSPREGGNVVHSRLLFLLGKIAREGNSEAVNLVKIIMDTQPGLALEALSILLLAADGGNEHAVTTLRSIDVAPTRLIPDLESGGYQKETFELDANERNANGADMAARTLARLAHFGNPSALAALCRVAQGCRDPWRAFLIVDQMQDIATPGDGLQQALRSLSLDLGHALVTSQVLYKRMLPMFGQLLACGNDSATQQMIEVFLTGYDLNICNEILYYLSIEAVVHNNVSLRQTLASMRELDVYEQAVREGNLTAITMMETLESIGNPIARTFLGRAPMVAALPPPPEPPPLATLAHSISVEPPVQATAPITPPPSVMPQASPPPFPQTPQPPNSDT